MGGGDGSTVSATATTAPPPAASGTPQTVAPEQAVAEFQKSDEKATSRTESLLGLPQNRRRTSPRSVEDVQNILGQVKRAGLVENPAVLQVRFTTQQASVAADLEAQNVVSLVPKGFERLDGISGTNPYVDEGFSALSFIQRGGEQLYASAVGASGVGSLSRASKRSEFTQSSNSQNEDAFLDLTLVGSEAPVEARRVSLNRGRFSTVEGLVQQLSRQEPLAVDDPASPSRQLHALLVAPLLESLKGQDIETVLIAADRVSSCSFRSTQ